MQNVSSSNSQAVIVPKLRFPEFGSSWQMKTLGDILSVKHGKDYKGQSNQIGKYPVMGTGGIITYIDSFMCDWECVCIGRKGTINKPIYMSEPFWSVDTLFFTQPQKGENPKFQYYLFETINWLLHNEASGVPSLSASVIANIKKAIPTIQEQNKIAAFFTVIDTLINKQNNLVESLKLYKRGVLQRLFKANITEHKENNIGSLFTVTRGYVLPLSEIRVEPDNEYCYPVYSSQTKNEGLMGYYNQYLYEDAITWTTDGANAGFVRFRKGKFYCTNVCGVLLNDDGFANEYIAERLNSVTKRHVSYVGNPKLMNNVMAEITIEYPSLEEQRKNSLLISQMDKKIQYETSVSDSLAKLKTALLQQMFI